MHGRIDGWRKTLQVFYLVLNCQENFTFPRMLAQEIMRMLEITSHIYNKFCTDFSKSQIVSRLALSLHKGINRNHFFFFFNQRFKIAMVQLPPFIIWRLFLQTVCATGKKQCQVLVTLHFFLFLCSEIHGWCQWTNVTNLVFCDNIPDTAYNWLWHTPFFLHTHQSFPR